jgi:hypothetical protein
MSGRGHSPRGVSANHAARRQSAPLAESSWRRSEAECDAPRTISVHPRDSERLEFQTRNGGAHIAGSVRACLGGLSVVMCV